MKSSSYSIFARRVDHKGVWTSWHLFQLIRKAPVNGKQQQKKNQQKIKKKTLDLESKRATRITVDTCALFDQFGQFIETFHQFHVEIILLSSSISTNLKNNN